jgi:hypothetical protein
MKSYLFKVILRFLSTCSVDKIRIDRKRSCQNNFLEENQTTEAYGENIWRIRDLIYSDCYPEIGIIPKKCPEDTHISAHFHEHKMPTIKRLHPAIFLMRPFYFNAKDYFSKGA